jgi:hypothetical protein
MGAIVNTARECDAHESVNVGRLASLVVGFDEAAKKPF